MEIEEQKIKEKMLSDDSLDKVSSFFSLFADKTRLTLINLLSENELCVNDIAKVMNMSQTRVSHQLAVLRQYDIVKYYRNGKQIFYTLTDNHIKDIFRTGLEHVSENDELVYSDKKKILR